MNQLFGNEYFLTGLAIAGAFVIGWIMSRYHTETKITREQTRRELELQKMATFAEYINNLQGGRNG